MKSAITASSGTPSPVIRMPVCPVARKLDFIPRAFISRSMHSAVYIFPTEQSVPTARQRLPLRLTPLAMGYCTEGTRTSCNCRPVALATATRSGSSRSRLCRPEARSNPSSKACTSTFFHAAEITPPRFATPITSVFAPAARASSSVMSGRRMSARHPSIRNWPTAFCGRQSLMPCATLAAKASGASPRNRRYGVSIIGLPFLMDLRQRYGFCMGLHCKSAAVAAICARSSGNCRKSAQDLRRYRPFRAGDAALRQECRVCKSRLHPLAQFHTQGRQK